MKSVILLFAAILFPFISLNAQPCPTDTVFIMGSPGHGEDTEILDDPVLPCYTYQCQVDSCHEWVLPDSFSGFFNVFTSAGPFYVSIQLWSDCHYIHLDTCARIDDSTVPSFGWSISLPMSSQIRICGPSLPVTIYLKPGPGLDTLGPPIVDVDTLCGPFIGIDQPIIAPKRTRYFDPVTFKEVFQLEANRFYLKR